LLNISPTEVIRNFMSPNQKSRQNSRPGRQNHKQSNRGRNQNGRGGRKGPGKNQSQQPLTATKQVDSHGPEGKNRGNVKQLYDKYKALAHESRTLDRTLSEAFGQYAHHYYTLYSEFAAAEAAQQLQRENEKQRKQQEAAENQSNIVPILDGDATAEDMIKIDEDTGGISDASATNNKNGSTTNTNTEASDLPLESLEAAQKPKKPRKAKKPKEKIAE